MAIDTTTFSQRMKTINAGKTTSWTVPGQGLASFRDERSFMAKAGIKEKTQPRTTKRNPVKFLVALAVGAGSVIAARWIDFTYLDSAIGLAAERGVDVASVMSGLPTSLSLAVLISVVSMFVLGLRTRQTVALQVTGFFGAFLFEAELVRLAPEVYARFYPPSWITDMIASASLLT